MPSDSMMRAILSVLRGGCFPSSASSAFGSSCVASCPFSCFSRGASDVARGSWASERVESVGDDMGRSICSSKVCGECGSALLAGRALEVVMIVMIGPELQDKVFLFFA